MPREYKKVVQCCDCRKNFDKSRNKISKHPFEKAYYCNNCLRKNLKNTTKRNLRETYNILKKLDDLNIINTFTVQKKNINTRKQYTLVSFKFDGFDNF